jgi:hypothetical protein
MIIELVLPNGKTYKLFVDNSSSQELESVLRKWAGLESITEYSPHLNVVVGWKDGKQWEACRIMGKLQLYAVPDAR